MISTLQTFLTQYGWSYVEPVSDRIVTGFQTDQRAYPLSIDWTDSWVKLQVEPLIYLDVCWEDWPEFLREISELNASCPLIKVGLNSEGQIFLSMELLRAHMSYGLFSDCLGIVGHHAEELYNHLLERVMTNGMIVGGHRPMWES
jgi:hypothetical protein